MFFFLGGGVSLSGGVLCSRFIFYIQSLYSEFYGIIRAVYSTIYSTRSSKRDTRFSKTLRIKFRVETVNLHLTGTVHV